MIESPTANFFGSAEALFSPGDIRRLIEAELERARRYDHPLTFLLVGVDRIDRLTDLYGHDSREDVFEAVVELLLSRLRVGDFLGCRDGDEFLLALPFTPPEGARALSERLLEGTRDLVFEADGRSLRITLSIGVAYAADVEDSETGVKDMIRTARRGLKEAVQDGGARVVEWKPGADEPSPELVSLRAELEARTRTLRESRERAAPALESEAELPPQAPPEPAGVDVEVGSGAADPAVARTAIADELEISKAAARAVERTLAEKLQVLLDTAAARPSREVDFQGQIEDLITQHNRQLGVLERRIGKLSKTLEATEAELKRMTLMRDVDASTGPIIPTGPVIRGSDEPEEKRGLMDAIFQANVQLQKDIAERKRGSAEGR